MFAERAISVVVITHRLQRWGPRFKPGIVHVFARMLKRAFFAHHRWITDIGESTWTAAVRVNHFDTPKQITSAIRINRMKWSGFAVRIISNHFITYNIEREGFYNFIIGLFGLFVCHRRTLMWIEAIKSSISLRRPSRFQHFIGLHTHANASARIPIKESI